MHTKLLTLSLLTLTLISHAAEEERTGLLDAAEQGRASQGREFWSVGPATFFDENSSEAQERKALVRDYMQKGGVEDESLYSIVDEAIDIWHQDYPGKPLPENAEELAKNAALYKNEYKEAMKQQAEQLWKIDLEYYTREIKGSVALSVNCVVTALCTALAIKAISS